MSRFTSLAALSVGLLGAIPAIAQPVDISSIDQTEILRFLNSKTIEPALKTVTGNHLVSVDAQNQAFVVATATNGIRFEIRFHGCEGSEPVKCKAMSMTSFWDPLKKSEAKKLSKTLPKFSLEHPLTNAGVLNDQRPYISRYVIADFGTAQGNIVSELANFIRSATDFANQVKKDGK